MPRMTRPPDFVTIGHAVRDLVPGGWRLGGTVTFAAVQAHRLGLRVGVVTRASADVDVAAELPFATVVQGASPVTTCFENVYERGHRRQRVREHAAPIAVADVPDAWREAPIILVGPVFGEVDAALAGSLQEQSVVGVSAQGWLRAADEEGNVVRAPWTGAPFWAGADAVFVSDEDLAEGEHQLDDWARDVAVIGMTESYRGARMWSGGAWRRMEAFPGDEVDPTGAGDTFATAFLVRWRETGDVGEAARFGAAAASLSIAGVACESTPDRAQIEQRMRAHPEVALR